MTEKEILKQQIAEAKAKLKKLEEETKNLERNAAIKNLDEFTPEEKIQIFDKFYKGALKELEDYEYRRYQDEDNTHYDWETYISILARDPKLFWKYWNSIDK